MNDRPCRIFGVKWLSYIFIISLIFCFSQAIAGEYHVDQTQENLVKFISDAPIENFEGVTDKIDGYLFWEGDDITNNSALYFEVDLNSIDTGIGLRNRHMRENYLHTDKYPITHYKGKITKVDSVSESQFKVSAEGEIFIHGINKSLSVEGTLIKETPDIFHIKTEFVVALSDFEIEIPSIMFYKIDENMQLVLDFYVKKFEENK
jgi:polyisoprenoid-binding protein YceI